MGHHLSNCQQCDPTQLLQSPAYGQYTLVDAKWAVIQKRVEGIDCYDKVVRELQKRKRIGKGVAKLEKYQVTKNDHWTTIKMMYQFIPTTLTGQIDSHRQSSQPFSENMLLSLISCISSSLQELNSFNICHGCIHPCTILFKPPTFFCLTDLSCTTYLSAYGRTLRGERGWLLSPNLCDKLVGRKVVGGHAMQDDLWALGMVVLLIVDGGPVSKYYQSESGGIKVNWKSIENGMRLLTRNYSSKLVCKVRQMINPERKESQLKSSCLKESLHEFSSNLSKVMRKLESSAHKQ